MARIKGGIMTHKRRKKVLKLAKGYYGSRSSLFKTTKAGGMAQDRPVCLHWQKAEKARLQKALDH